MEEILPFKIDLGTYKEEILIEIAKVIDSGTLILGPYTKIIEEQWAADHGKRHGIAVNSDTAALESVLQLFDIKGTVVLMPQTAFFACANVVLRLGGIVGLVDVNPANGIMPTMEHWANALRYLRARNLPCKVVMVVYTTGQCSPFQTYDIRKLRQDYQLIVLEDCAHCHGARYANGEYVGSAGDFSTWSTYATKLLHSGEGGMIVTDNTVYAEQLRFYRAYGSKIYDGIFQECVSEKGYNWRMTEFQAAILTVMWKHLPEIIQQRRIVANIYDEYFRNLRSNPDATPADLGEPYRLLPPDITPNLYRYPVMIPGMTFESNRSLYQYLVSCTPKITLQAKCNHLPLGMHAAYQNHPRVLNIGNSFPGAMQYCLEHICLPIYPLFKAPNYVAEKVLYWWEQNKDKLRP